MDIGVLRDLSLELFWTLFFVQIFRNESLTLWPVHSCPGNQSEVEAATIRLNCSDVKESINVYHCLPLSNLSQLVEFCYDARSGLIEAGNCMVLFRDTLNNHQCGHFTTGCPNDYYFPKYMYSYKYKELELLNREPPSLKTDLKTNTPEHSMILVCEVIVSQRSLPVTEIIWTKNNVEIDIPINDGKYVGGSLANPSLQINEVNESDVGVYQCSATNAVGTICSEIIHLESPILRLQGAFSEDNEVTISYSFVNEGSPKVHSIKWTKDGNPLDRKTAKYSGGGLEATFLKIHSPSEDDIGEYGCEISSVLGSAKDSLSLKPPALKTDLKANIPEHSMILVCEVTVSQRSPPVTDIFWTKDGRKIDITMNRGKYIGGSLADASLQINEVNQSDVGVYRCCATNAAGTTWSEIINLEHKDLDNKDFWDRYQKYLEEGSVEVCPISQIIIVGQHGVGKTTLLYRLQGRSLEEIKAIRSTRGVDCHTEKHSFIITKNQLKMNEKGISSFSPDPEQIYELAAGKKNDAKGSHGGSTPDSLIQPKLSSTKSETAETVNDDSSSSHMEIRQENDQVDNSRQSKQKIQSEHKPKILPFHSKETKHEREPAKNKETQYNKSLLPMLKAQLEENRKLMSRFGNRDDVVLDVLDFAGQGEYYASHQTYIRKDAIFILVVDTSKNVNKRLVLPEHKENKTSHFLCDRPGVVFNCWSPKDYFYYWLNTIRMHGGNSERIIFIGTHKNKIRKDFDFDRLLDDTTKEKLMPRKYFKPVITDLLRFDEKTNNEIAEIKNEICKLIKGENGETVKECRPAKWVKYMNMIDVIKRNFQIVRIEEILEMIDHFDLSMSDTEIADMLHFFHRSGKIIFFNIENLQQSIILDIQWFIDCFKHIISDRKHVEEDCKIVDDEEKEMLNYFQDKGVLEVSIYNKLLKQKNIPQQYWSTLGEYQSKLGLMFCIKNFKIDESVTIKEGWYVPSINTQEFRPNITEYRSKESSQILCFRFRDYLPHDLFGRVVVACLKTGHWHPYDFRLCKTGVDFCFQNMTEEEQIYLYTDKRIITVQFIGKHSEENGPIVRQEIDSKIRRFCQFYASSTKYEVGFLCRKKQGYKENSIKHFVSADKKYCQGCSKRFLQELNEAELFWKEKVSDKQPNSTIGEMDALQIACEVYFHILKRATDKTDKIRTLQSVDLERNTQWLDNLVDVEQKLKDLHRKTREASEEKETEIRNINRDLKSVAFGLKDVCRDLRKEIFFLLTQTKDISKNNHGIPVIALECTDDIVQIGTSISLEAKSDMEIRDHRWLRKTFQENKYRILHPDDQEEKFEFKEMDGKRVLMIKNFLKQDEGHHYFIVVTDNGYSVCRKTLFSADIIEVFLDKLKKGNLEPMRNNACGILIGCAGSGKTTLIERLKGNDLAEIKKNTRSTRGLDIRTDILNLKDTMKEKKITIVDSAGLCVYNATHHIFLSPQAFFVLVLNMEKKFDDKVDEEEVCSQEDSIFKGWTQRDFLTYWMKSIPQYSSEKVPVIMVGTHAEDKSEQDKAAFFREVWKTLTTKYKPSFKHLHIKRQFAVGFDDNENLEQIKQAIADVVQELDHWGGKIQIHGLYLKSSSSRKKVSEL